MSDKMRWRYGDTNPVVAAVDSATVIEIGDLVYQDVDDAKPAASQADQGSASTRSGRPTRRRGAVGRSPAARGPSASPAAPPPEDEQPELIESLLTIWTEPRATIRCIVAVDPGFWVNRIAALVGLVFAIAFFNSAADAGLTGGATGMSSTMGIILAVVLWPPLMILALYFSAWLTRLTGAWLLDGQAGSPAIRTALAWSYIPLLVLLPLAVLAPVLSRVSAGGSGLATAVLAIFGLLYLTATIWCLVIQCQGVAEVQGFRSAWKGLLNILLPGLLFVGVSAVLLLVVGVVGLLFGGGR